MWWERGGRYGLSTHSESKGQLEMLRDPVGYEKAEMIGELVCWMWGGWVKGIKRFVGFGQGKVGTEWWNGQGVVRA